MTRKPINKDIEAAILVESRRRCCICFGLNSDLNLKAGQIAHLDKDNSNNNYDNLAFLCLAHHDQYDSVTSQSKNFTIKEVKKYRDDLKENFLSISKPKSPSTEVIKNSIEDYRKEEIRKLLIEILTDNGTITHFMPIEHKTGLSKVIIENNLIALSQENVVRIDRKQGSLRRTFSLANSTENLIIDAFMKTLGDTVTDEERYLRKNNYEIDAIIKTTVGEYVIEVKNAKYLNPDRIRSTISRVNSARREFHISENAKNVLLIGVDYSTEGLNDSLKEIEKTGVIVKFIEINDLS